MADLWTGIRVESAPAAEPISLNEAKDHLRLDHDDEDAYISGLISAVRIQLEKLLNRALVTQTLDVSFPRFPSPSREIVLPRAPLESVTWVRYYDKDDTESTLDTDVYAVDAVSEPGRLVLKRGQSWPTLTLRPDNPVIVRQVCGYGIASAVPKHIRQAILLGIGDLYEHRESTITGTIVARTGALRWLVGHEKIRGPG